MIPLCWQFWFIFFLIVMKKQLKIFSLVDRGSILSSNRRFGIYRIGVGNSEKLKRLPARLIFSNNSMFLQTMMFIWNLIDNVIHFMLTAFLHEMWTFFGLEMRKQEIRSVESGYSEEDVASRLWTRCPNMDRTMFSRYVELVWIKW